MLICYDVLSYDDQTFVCVSVKEPFSSLCCLGHKSLCSAGVWISGCFCTYAHVDLALDGRFMQWRVVPVVSGGGLRTVVKQQTHHLHENPNHTKLQSSLKFKGESRHFTTLAINTWMYLSVAEGAGVMERYQSSVVPGVDVGSIPEEEVHHVFTAKTWRCRKWREWPQAVHQACNLFFCCLSPLPSLCLLSLYTDKLFSEFTEKQSEAATS